MTVSRSKGNVQSIRRRVRRTRMASVLHASQHCKSTVKQHVYQTPMAYISLGVFSLERLFLMCNNMLLFAIVNRYFLYYLLSQWQVNFNGIEHMCYRDTWLKNVYRNKKRQDDKSDYILMRQIDLLESFSTISFWTLLIYLNEYLFN